MEEHKNGEQVGYDPAHVGAMIVLVLFSLAILFWLFWSLLVFKGGLLIKLWVLIQIISGSKSSVAIAPEWWDGWVINVGALILSGLVVAAVSWIFKRKGK